MTFESKCCHDKRKKGDFSNSYKELEDEAPVTAGIKRCTSACRQGLLFLPQIRSCFVIQIYFFCLLPHILPVENPQIATQHFKQTPTPSEKPSAGPARGFPSLKKRGGGPILVINTSRSAEGIRVWACSAAYVDPAASFRGWFSSGAGCTSVIPLTQQRSQKLFKNGSSMFCGKERHNLKRGMMPATSPSRGAWVSMRNSEMIQGGAQTFSFQTFLSACKHMRQLP